MGNKPDMKYLARLARLELTEDEERTMQRELCEFVELAGVLDGYCEGDELECKGSGQENLFREDIAFEYGGRGLLSIAPSSAEGYITVPLTVREVGNDT